MKIFLLITLLVLTSSAQVHAGDPIWQLQVEKTEGEWTGTKYYTFRPKCVSDLVDAANDSGWDIDRFRCVEVAVK